MEGALQRHNPVKYRLAWLRIFGIYIKVAMTEELELVLRLGIHHIRLDIAMNDGQ